LGEDALAEAAWEAGARGLFRLGEQAAEDLPSDLDAVKRGHVVIDRALVAAVYFAVPGEPAALEPLSDQDKEILRLVAEGYSNKEVAHRLGVSERTVKHHLQTVFDKLNIHDRAGAVARSLRLGLLQGGVPREGGGRVAVGDDLSTRPPTLDRLGGAISWRTPEVHGEIQAGPAIARTDSQLCPNGP